MNERADQANTKFANETDQNLNIAPNFNGVVADFLGDTLARRRALSLGGKICRAVVEQFRKLRPEPSDLEISAFAFLQFPELNQERDARAVAFAALMVDTA